MKSREKRKSSTPANIQVDIVVLIKTHGSVSCGPRKQGVRAQR